MPLKTVYSTRYCLDEYVLLYWNGVISVSCLNHLEKL